MIKWRIIWLHLGTERTRTHRAINTVCQTAHLLSLNPVNFRPLRPQILGAHFCFVETVDKMARALAYQAPRSLRIIMSVYCVHYARLQQPRGYYCAPCIPPLAHRSSAAVQWLNPLPWRGLIGVLNRLCSIRFGPASASPSPPTPPSCIGHSDAVNAQARVQLPSAVEVVKPERPFVERH